VIVAVDDVTDVSTFEGSGAFVSAAVVNVRSVEVA
jgi:hypothetical protein